MISDQNAELQAEANEFIRRCLLAFVEANGQEPNSLEELLTWVATSAPTLLPKGKMS